MIGWHCNALFGREINFMRCYYSGGEGARSSTSQTVTFNNTCERMRERETNGRIMTRIKCAV